MKREIKFRAKETSGKDWCYGIMHNEGINLFPVSVDMETICQFTGRNDKNGKEIYEGDILKPINREQTCQVLFSERSASYILVFVSPAKPAYDMGLYDVERFFEVIGNIYDNKELLEE
ncbi:YopX family protein [Phocaeicola coprophilus]|uniref:YopX family protein n=1 Tax=Phocaeicola coprophilus TaxID=387090 RepID=UPI0039F4F2C1